jgi:hypothetical protein
MRQHQHDQRHHRHQDAGQPGRDVRWPQAIRKNGKRIADQRHGDEEQPGAQSARRTAARQDQQQQQHAGADQQPAGRDRDRRERIERDPHQQEGAAPQATSASSRPHSPGPGATRRATASAGRHRRRLSRAPAGAGAVPGSPPARAARTRAARAPRAASSRSRCLRRISSSIRPATRSTCSPPCKEQWRQHQARDEAAEVRRNATPPSPAGASSDEISWMANHSRAPRRRAA